MNHKQVSVLPAHTLVNIKTLSLESNQHGGWNEMIDRFINYIQSYSSSKPVMSINGNKDN